MDEREGYRPDSEYLLTYQAELAPPAIDFAVLLSGRQPPEGRRYLELGCGRGRSLNIHAAARPGRYLGVDFNPGHIRDAGELASATRSGASFTTRSFSEFAAGADITAADYIVLHGVWSWVPPDARAAVTAIIERALAPGGVVLVSYDALPGALGKSGLRELLQRLRGQGGDTAAALRWAKSALEADAGFFAQHPHAKALLEIYLAREARFAEHDILNPYWSGSYVAEVAGEMAGVGLEFLGPARVLDRLDTVRMPPAQKALLARETSPLAREIQRDFLARRVFRHDLYGRDVIALDAAEQSARLRDQAFVLIKTPEAAFKAVKSDEATAVIFALARDDAAPKRFAALETDPSLAALPPGRLLEAIVALVGSDLARPVQAPEDAEAGLEACRRLNRRVIEMDGREPMSALASPLLGAGVRLSREERTAIVAGRAGQIAPARRALLARLMIA